MRKEKKPRRGDRTARVSVAPPGLRVVGPLTQGCARKASLHPGLPSVAPPGLQTGAGTAPLAFTRSRAPDDVAVRVEDAGSVVLVRDLRRHAQRRGLAP